MEKPEINKLFEDLSQKEGIAGLFTAEDLAKLSDELVAAIGEILEGREVKEVIFEEGEAMFYRLDDNTIFLASINLSFALTVNSNPCALPLAGPRATVIYTRKIRL